MEDDVGLCEAVGERQFDVPVRPLQRDDAVRRELLGERPAELPARAGDYVHACRSRSERSGVSVLQRCLTRGSAQQIPCSSGSAGSYSSVTW